MSRGQRSVRQRALMNHVHDVDSDAKDRTGPITVCAACISKITAVVGFVPDL